MQCRRNCVQCSISTNTFRNPGKPLKRCGACAIVTAFNPAASRARRKPPIDHRVLARPWFGAASLRARSLLGSASRRSDLPPAAARRTRADDAKTRTLEISTKQHRRRRPLDEADFSARSRSGMARATITARERVARAERRRRLARAVSNSVGPDVMVFGEDAHYDPESRDGQLRGRGLRSAEAPGARLGAADRGHERQPHVAREHAVHDLPAGQRRVGDQRARQPSSTSTAASARARGVKLDFKGVPILYVPYFSFPINDRAQERLPDARHQQPRPHGLRLDACRTT